MTNEVSIQTVADLIQQADALVIGIGAGMSASGGISYSDPKLLERWFPEYAALGFKGLMEVQSVFWNLTKENVRAYWGYWARHIYLIRYQSEVLSPYQKLVKLIWGKEYFICTTNADGQTQKAGFDKKRIFAPQGNYEGFQCITPCTRNEIYPNEKMIKEMIKSIDERYEIAESCIPRCPRCGNFLIPNLRCDDQFVEVPHLKHLKDYEAFINQYKERRIVFLELGVGYNTPGIIRYPFERMTYEHPKSRLVRVNQGMAQVPREIMNQSVGIDGDLDKVLGEILEVRKEIR